MTVTEIVTGIRGPETTPPAPTALSPPGQVVLSAYAAQNTNYLTQNMLGGVSGVLGNPGQVYAQVVSRDSWINLSVTLSCADDAPPAKLVLHHVRPTIWKVPMPKLSPQCAAGIFASSTQHHAIWVRLSNAPA
ncbi:MAG TPA: hypothetical protein VEH52_13425 [Gaiellaceae bacterium]|nr:hypothetical protein [Gaiellaceae bacterium]